MIWIRIYQFLSPVLFGVLEVLSPILPFMKRARLVRTENPTPYIPDKRFIQFHCASLGEYEMALPLIIHYAKNHPILVSFYSPSGFNHAKVPANTNHEIVTCYLPFDVNSQIRKFYSLVNVKTVVVLKYEIWPNWLLYLNGKKIPVVMANGNLPKDHFLFLPIALRAYQVLNRFTAIVVQSEAMQKDLQQLLTTPVHYAPDLRYERVSQLSAEVDPLPKVEEFKGNKPLLVLGSSWETEEKLLAKILNNLPNIRVVIAPHNIDPTHIASIFKWFKPFGCGTWDDELSPNQQVLVVNRIGLLKSVYSYADASIVGGAFGKGLHNILESLAFGAPVLFGPDYSNFPEAKEAIKQHAGYSFTNEFELQTHLEWLFSDPACLEGRQYYARKMIRSFGGSVEKHIEVIEEAG